MGSGTRPISRPACGERSITTRLKSSADLLLAFFLAALFAGLLFSHPQSIFYDQRFILHPLGSGEFLQFDDGLVTRFVVALFALPFGSADPQRLNTGVSLLSMLFFVGAALALARRELKTQTGLCLFVAVLFASRFPVLWLSTELIVGAFVSLSVLAIVSGADAVVVGTLLALTAFTKPDLLVLSSGVLGYYVYTSRRQGKRALLAFALAALVLNGPGLLLKGSHYFGARAFGSVTQHYADLVRPHQLSSKAPDPWTHSEEYMAAGFPGAHSIGDLVVRHTSRYVDFVALSAAKGFKNLIRALGLLFLLIPLRLFLAKRGAIPVRQSERLFVVSLVGLIPLVAFSYPHVRYLARYYPLFLVSMLAMVEQLLGNKNARKFALLRPLALGVVTLALAMQVVAAYHGFAALEPGAPLWFPD